VITALHGYPLARQGRACEALMFILAIGFGPAESSC
jgi:hypothetical protein